MRIHAFILIAFVLLSINALAQDTTSHSFTGITASKNGVDYFYKTGTRLLVKYKSDSSTIKARGILTSVSDMQISLRRMKNSGEQATIRVEDITLLKKVNPKRRIVFAIVGTALVAGGAAFLDHAGNSPGSALRSAFVIPVIGVGSYFLCAIPVSLLFEKANEKKRKNGWRFFVP